MREFIAFPLEDTAEREREDPLEDSMAITIIYERNSSFVSV